MDCIFWLIITNIFAKPCLFKQNLIIGLHLIFIQGVKIGNGLFLGNSFTDLFVSIFKLTFHICKHQPVLFRIFKRGYPCIFQNMSS